MVQQYRTRPNIVNAIQFDPHRQPWPEGIISWKVANYQPRDMSWGFIQTPEGGRLHVCAGDWIVTNFNGEQSICKPEIFKWLYERIEERDEVNHDYRW